MKKNNILFQKVIVIIITFILMFSVNIPISFADVGDYGSDWSDSDWGSSSDSSWDYDDDYSSSWDDDYSYSSSSSGSSMSFGGFLFFVFIIIIICTSASRKHNSRSNWYRNDYYKNRNIYGRPNTVRPNNNMQYGNDANPLNLITSENSQKVEQEIIAVDELFSREEFESWVKQIFIRLQYAWTDRNWTEIRPFETNELFEQHNTQLNRYIERKQINVLEQVSVKWVKLYKFYQTAERDVLEVVINSRMIDYIIDEETKKVIAGDKMKAKIRTY